MSEDNSSLDQAKPLVTELQKILSMAQETYTQLEAQKNSILSSAHDASRKQEELKDKQETLTAQMVSLDGQRSTIQNLSDAIIALKVEAEDNRNSVINDVQVITEKRAEFEEFKNQAQTAKEEMTARQAELATKISEINSAYDRITQQLKVLFDDSTDQEGAVIRAVVNQFHDSNTAIKDLLAETKRTSELASAEIGSFVSRTEDQLKDIAKNSQEQVSALKISLEQEIRALLPEAGAAGLASAFYEAKSKYAVTSVEPKVKNVFLYHLLKVWHFLVSSLTPIFFYSMFILPLLAIVWIFYDLLDFIKEMTKTAPSDMRIDITILFLRFLLALPLATISWFGWSSIRLYRRLYEEYNHKQRVMQLYHSFKTEIDTDGEDHHKKSLLAIMLTTVGDKPSLAMHDYDHNGKSPWSIFGKSEPEQKSD